MTDNQNNPLVSVIMPCYNHERYVGQSIESVLNQTYDNIEFIVLDNGSSDHSYDVIKKYESQIDQILQFDKNDINQAGRVLLEHCTGNYIAFMTSDDIWEKEKIEKQMSVLKSNKKVKACFTWVNMVDENMNIIGQEGGNIFRQANRSRYEWIKRLVLQGNCLAFPSAIVEKEAYYAAFERIKPFYQLGDLFMWIQMLMENDIYIVEEPLISFRWHARGENQNTSSPNQKVDIRTRNEQAVILEAVVENMDDEIFIHTFGDYFRNKNACSKEELLCEKFFLLTKLAEKAPCYGQCAINYYFRHNNYSVDSGYSLINMLDSLYNYTYLDFQEYCAGAGMSAMDFKIQYLAEQQNLYLDRQNLYLAVICSLQEAMDTDFNKEQRTFFYRQRVYQRLLDGQKKILEVVADYLRGVLTFIENANDDILEKEYGSFIHNVQETKVILQELWNMLLQFDSDINEEEWNRCKEILQRQQIEVEEFCDLILPFLVRLYNVLLQYLPQQSG